MGDKMSPKLEALYDEMMQKTKENIELFKQIIELEKARVQTLSNEQVIELKDSTRNN